MKHWCIILSTSCILITATDINLTLGLLFDLVWHILLMNFVRCTASIFCFENMVYDDYQLKQCSEKPIIQSECIGEFIYCWGVVSSEQMDFN